MKVHIQSIFPGLYDCQPINAPGWKHAVIEAPDIKTALTIYKKTMKPSPEAAQ